MTKERLEEYRSNKDEIKELEHKLAHLGEGDSMIGNDVVFDYRTGFPQPQAVVGVDWEKYDRLKELYQSRVAKLREECAEVEQWIDGIQNGQMRRIFRMRYMDGMSQAKIGKAVHLDRSRVSRKIDDFLKNAHKAQNAHV